MLTVTLRGLERDGLVERAIYPEVPPRVEYTLTKLGGTLRELVRGLVKWSGAHLGEVDAARATYDAEAGQSDEVRVTHDVPTPIPRSGARQENRVSREAVLRS